MVTVIMPFFNAESFIQESVESILAQTYSDWELVLVDDGSLDSSTRIAHAYVAQYPDRIRCVEHDGHENLGISAARNTGVRHATGKYIAFLDADDVWLPHKLQSQVAILDAHPGASMLYGRTEYWHSWTRQRLDQRRNFVPDHGIEADTLHDPPSLLLAVYPLGQATAPSMSNLMMRRELLERTGGFEEAFRGMFEDQAFLVKAYLNGSVYVSNEQWDRYRIHPHSCSSEATRAGEETSHLLFFLRWFDSWLQDRGINDVAIQDALCAAFDREVPRGDLYYNGWNFRVAGSNAARLLIPEAEPETMRIVIDRTQGSATHDTQLNHPNFNLLANESYTLTFRARADRERQVGVGVSMAHPPWDGLGFYKNFDLTDEWRVFREEFTAAADDGNGRLHFDLGGSDVAVEIADVSFLSADGTPACGVVQFGALRRVTPISQVWGSDRGQPVDRYYIENFLARRASDIRGRVMEIQESNYTRRFGANRVTKSDVLDVLEGNPQATFVADLTNAPQIPSDTFDCIVFTQTLQHIYDAKATISTLHRILKPGGVLLATVPGISKTNDARDDWYWLFTPLSAKRLVGEAFEAANIAIESFGNVLSATAFLYGLSAGELTRDELDYCDKGYEVTICIRASKSEKAG